MAVEEARQRQMQVFEKCLGFPVYPADALELDVPDEIALRDPVLVSSEDLMTILVPPFHMLDISEIGGERAWTILHPVKCRPEIADCRVHAAMMVNEPEDLEPGRYKVKASHSGHVYAERMDGPEKTR